MPPRQSLSNRYRLMLLLIATAVHLTCPCGAGRLAAEEEPQVRELQRPIRVIRNLVYREVDGKRLRADVYRLDDDSVCPLVMMVHGGAWSSGDKWNLQDHARELAQAGYVAVTINYRLAPLFQFPKQLDDCQHALRWMVEQGERWQGDVDSVGVWGYSAGGHLAALLALQPDSQGSPISAAVLGGVPCEFSFVPEDSRVLSAVFGGSRSEKPEIYQQASPIEFVSASACPTFFFHGTKDLLVPQASSQRLHAEMRQLGVPTEYVSVEGTGHLLTFIDHRSRRRAIEFLNQHLMATD